jgi:hypothetical protein
VRASLFVTFAAASACATDAPRGDDSVGETGKVVTLDIAFVPGPHDLVGDPCIPVPLVDVLPDTPGLQPDCSASLVVEDVETVLPSCDLAAPSCFSLAPDAQNCFEADRIKLVPLIDPEPTSPFRVLLQCVSR